MTDATTTATVVPLNEQHLKLCGDMAVAIDELQLQLGVLRAAYLQQEAELMQSLNYAIGKRHELMNLLGREYLSATDANGNWRFDPSATAFVRDSEET